MKPNRFIQQSAIALIISGTLACLMAQETPPVNSVGYQNNPAFMDNIRGAFSNENYSFFIDSSGILTGFSDATGNVIFDTIGKWIIQANSSEHVAAVNGESQVEVKETRLGDTPVFEVTTKHPRAIEKKTITCHSNKAEIIVEFEVVDMDSTMGIVYPIKANKENIRLWAGKADSNPVEFENAGGGRVLVGYGGNELSPYGTKGNSGLVPRESEVTIYPNFEGNRTQGAKDRFEVTLTPIADVAN